MSQQHEWINELVSSGSISGHCGGDGSTNVGPSVLGVGYLSFGSWNSGNVLGARCFERDDLS